MGYRNFPSERLESLRPKRREDKNYYYNHPSYGSGVRPLTNTELHEIRYRIFREVNRDNWQNVKKSLIESVKEDLKSSDGKQVTALPIGDAGHEATLEKTAAIRCLARKHCGVLIGQFVPDKKAGRLVAQVVQKKTP